MRVLFYSLLVFNIVFLLWEINRPEQQTVSVINNAEQRILLVSEWQQQSASKQTQSRQVMTETLADQQTITTDTVSEPTQQNELELNLKPLDSMQETQLVNIEKSLVDDELAETDEQHVAAQIFIGPPAPSANKQTEPAGVNKQSVVDTEVKTDRLAQQFQPIQTEDNKEDELEPAENKQIHAQYQQDSDQAIKEAEKNIIITADSSPDQSALQDSSPAELCFDIGPFVDQQALTQWGNEQAFKSLSIEEREQEMLSSFLVYIPGKADFSQSKKIVKKLENKGITDYWLFVKGEQKGDISLGLFKQNSRALRLQKKYQQMGFSVQISPRYKTVTQWYAKVISTENIQNNLELIAEGQSILNCHAD